MTPRQLKSEVYDDTECNSVDDEIQRGAYYNIVTTMPLENIYVGSISSMISAAPKFASVFQDPRLINYMCNAEGCLNLSNLSVAFQTLNATAPNPNLMGSSETIKLRRFEG